METNSFFINSAPTGRMAIKTLTEEHHPVPSAEQCEDLVGPIRIEHLEHHATADPVPGRWIVGPEMVVPEQPDRTLDIRNPEKMQEMIGPLQAHIDYVYKVLFFVLEGRGGKKMPRDGSSVPGKESTFSIHHLDTDTYLQVDMSKLFSNPVKIGSRDGKMNILHRLDHLFSREAAMMIVLQKKAESDRERDKAGAKKGAVSGRGKARAEDDAQLTTIDTSSVVIVGADGANKLLPSHPFTILLNFLIARQEYVGTVGTLIQHALDQLDQLETGIVPIKPIQRRESWTREMLTKFGFA